MNRLTKKILITILFTLCIFLFIYLTKLLLLDEVKVFDDFVFKYVSKIRSNPLTIIFKFFSFLCNVWFIFILTIIIMLVSKNRKITFYIVLNLLLCFVLNQSLKFIFARTRPEDINLIIESGYSFPSGHSMVSLAYYGFFIYLILKTNMKSNIKILYTVLLSLLVFLIGLSRIYLGVHYASDVLAGYALSLAYLILFIQFFYKKRSD